ncbi:MAG: hypothetical protein LC802_23195 [Acidobacteria bacterium]|nr:hypothetical protein [Acidobacteriota bacterium]
MIFIRPRSQNPRTCAARRSFALAFVLSLAFAGGGVIIAHPRQQQQDAQTMRLAQIEFDGLKRVRPDEALAASGLQVGQAVGVNEVDAAANKLMGAGLFKNLSYSVRGTSEKAVIIFKVEELTSTMPVIFDNFYWFTDEELASAVRRKLPSFDGTAPESGGVTDTIKLALEELLRERKIPATVEYTFSDERRGRSPEHLFMVKGAGLRVCRLEFPGARALQQELLVQKSGGIFDNDYSRRYVGVFAENSLLPLYHERGYLRASFLQPKVEPVEAGGECEGGGVRLSMPVEEGPVYLWEKAEWSGQEALTPQELDAALGMRGSEIANVLKVDKGVGAVRKAYGRKGYLTAQVAASPAFDDAGRRVTFRFRVTEGAQYRMGALYIEGLSEQDTNNLRVRWNLMSRDVYDEGYVVEFVKKGVAEFVRDAARNGRPLKPFKIESSARPDREKLTVDVTLAFKPDTPAAPEKAREVIP